MFQGRTDFLGAEEGGCVRLESFGQNVDLLWAYQAHLTGTRPPIGIYPVVEQYELAYTHPTSYEPNRRKWFGVKFGAVDIDFEDLPLAINIWKALQVLGLNAFVERSRSKGYHVWLFCAEWVPAVLVRSALQVACDVVGYAPKEIFPKQTELVDGSPGNYIRLPYPGALLQALTPERRVVLSDAGEPVSLQRFVEAAWEGRVGRAALEQAAALAPKPKTRTVLRREGSPTAEVTALVPKMGGLAFTIFEHGPLDGADRSGTLFKLVHAIHASGLTADEAFVLLRDADERWGKFSDRADGESRLWEIIERVYDE